MIMNFNLKSSLYLLLAWSFLASSVAMSDTYPLCSKYIKAKDVLTSPEARYERSIVGGLSQYHGFVSCAWNVLNKTKGFVPGGIHGGVQEYSLCKKIYNCHLELYYLDIAECFDIAEETQRYRFNDPELNVHPNLCRGAAPSLCSAHRFKDAAFICKNVIYEYYEKGEALPSTGGFYERYKHEYRLGSYSLGCNSYETQEYHKANFERVCPDNAMAHFRSSPPTNKYGLKKVPRVTVEEAAREWAKEAEASSTPSATNPHPEARGSAYYPAKKPEDYPTGPVPDPVWIDSPNDNTPATPTTPQSGEYGHLDPDS